MNMGTELSNSSLLSNPAHMAEHVTIWNRIEYRKIAGNAAPLRRNLEKYLLKHPECEVYQGQEKALEQRGIAKQNEHVPIWHKLDRRKVRNCSVFLPRQSCVSCCFDNVPSEVPSLSLLSRTLFLTKS